MPIFVRPGRLSDFETLLALEQGFDPGERISPRGWRRFLSQRGKVFIAELDKAPAAAAVILTRKGSSRARLYSLITDPAFRGRGIARALIQAIETELARRGLDHLALEVRSDNPAAITLYQRLGFRSYGQKPGYYSDGTLALLMSKALMPHERQT